MAFKHATQGFLSGLQAATADIEDAAVTAAKLAYPENYVVIDWYVPQKVACAQNFVQMNTSKRVLKCNAYLQRIEVLSTQAAANTGVKFGVATSAGVTCCARLTLPSTALRLAGASGLTASVVAGTTIALKCWTSTTRSHVGPTWVRSWWKVAHIT